VHNIFMRDPGNAFHDDESAKQYGYVGQPVHNKLNYLQIAHPFLHAR
jgi:hypothetical protein